MENTANTQPTKTTTTAAETKEQAISRIAASILHIDSLVPQHRDSLDFYELSVGTIQRALELAFEAGQAAR